MKKNIKTKLLFSAASLLVLFGCSQKLEEAVLTNDENSDGVVTEVLTLQNEPQTKATLGNEVSSPTKAWEDGDMIAVWVGTDATHGDFQNCTVTGFGTSIEVNLLSTTNRYNYAVYPYKYSAEGSVIPSYTAVLSVNLPSSYDYVEVGGTKNPVPMVASNLSGSKTLTFYTVGALARISVSAIPSRASKLVVSFDKTVTGSFTVQDPGTTAPHIDINSESAASTVTINLTRGADYAGGAINIPVPQGTVNVISVAAYDGTTLLETVGTTESKVIDAWEATRAHGKKATVAYTRSIGSMFIAPGNLYTDGGANLLMSPNWYSNMYVLTGGVDEDPVDGMTDDTDNNVADGLGKNAFETEDQYNTNGNKNRTHFNWNEMYYLFNDTAPSAITWKMATTGTGVNEKRDYPMSKSFAGTVWRVPSEDDGNLIVGTGRPGASLNGSHGWTYVKLMVTGMGENGGTTRLNGSNEAAAQNRRQMGPSTTYQAGVLLLPDNVELDVDFDEFSFSSGESGKYHLTQITKDKLNVLISQGCAFLPAVGHWTYYLNPDTSAPYRFNGVGNAGVYWVATQSINDNESWVGHDDYRMGACYISAFNNGDVRITTSANPKRDFESIRLVRDAFPVE